MFGTRRIAAFVAVFFSLLCIIAASLLAGEPLPGTQPLTAEGDLAEQMVAGIDRFLLDQLAKSVAARAAHWKRDLSSAEKYNASVGPNRQRLAKIIGAQDPRPKPPSFKVTNPNGPLRYHDGGIFEVHWTAVRGVNGEGLLLTPTRQAPRATIIALPDADHTPEMLAGLVAGVSRESQFVLHLAESGCAVLIPLLVDRADTYSATELGRHTTNQPHREFIYRPAFELGRHVIGYEVQKVLAAVDHFAEEKWFAGKPIIVMGYGEGGLLALLAAALDTRINGALVSGYFDSRQNVWQEPIYRNVFGLLEQFGDAELASLIAPRPLIIEAAAGPQVAGPPAPREGHNGAAPGRLVTPAVESVRREMQRAGELVDGLNPSPLIKLVVSGDGNGPFGRREAMEVLLDSLHVRNDLGIPADVQKEVHSRPKPVERLRRTIAEMVDDTQDLLRECEYTRNDFWAKADRASRDPAKWQETTRSYREHFYNDVIGRFAIDRKPPNVRSRQVYDEPNYVGYEVVLDVFDDVFAYGILLLPKDLQPGERRPVVVCQHGLEGRPQDVADPKINNPAYNQFACQLANCGFITFAPQNPYIGRDKFRTLQRKANPLGKTLFSIIVPQHQQIVDWLATLPQVDPERIGFYGLSYGGKTAMRVPALVERYCLSICSADFNEWIWKNASTRSSYSYVHTGEYEIFEFDLGNTYNYAEMAGLICPRPFMVERGHRDGVGPDSQVAYEYAKVRLLYADLKIPDRTTIEFFDGPHTIHGVGTFEFLHQQLRWPKR